MGNLWQVLDLRLRRFVKQSLAKCLTLSIQLLSIWLRVLLLVVIALKLSIWTNFELFQRYLPDHTHKIHIPLTKSTWSNASEHLQVLAGTVALTQRFPLHPSPVVPVPRPVLISGQFYEIRAQILVPESPPNIREGMFKICVNLYEEHGNNTLGGRQSCPQWAFPEGSLGLCRWVMIKYTSSMVQTVATILKLPLYLLDWDTESQVLSWIITESHEENPVFPSARVSLRIFSQNLQVYEAWIQITTEYRGFRYFVFHHPYLTSSVSILIGFYVFLALLAISGMFRMLISTAMSIPERY